jgi:hypothetical protein|eukprot:COSAG01_NODE_3519_length_5979_cov_340.102551_5_plen_294_part_00
MRQRRQSTGAKGCAQPPAAGGLGVVAGSPEEGVPLVQPLGGSSSHSDGGQSGGASALAAENSGELTERFKHCAQQVTASALVLHTFDSEEARRTLEDPRAVVFSVTIHQLGDVDLVRRYRCWCSSACTHPSGVAQMRQSFYTDIGIHMSWMEPGLVSRERTGAVTELDPSDSAVHVPTIFISKRLEVAPVNEPIVAMRAKDPPGVVRWEQRFSGTLRQHFDMRYFPFDVQTLTVELRINSKYDDERKRYAVSLQKGIGHVSACIVALIRQTVSLIRQMRSGVERLTKPLGEVR